MCSADAYARHRADHVDLGFSSILFQLVSPWNVCIKQGDSCVIAVYPCLPCRMINHVFRAFAVCISHGDSHASATRAIKITQVLEKGLLRVTFTNDQQRFTNPMLFACHHSTLQLRDGAISTRHVFCVQVVIGTHTLDAIQSPGIALAVFVFFNQHDLGLVQQT